MELAWLLSGILIGFLLGLSTCYLKGIINDKTYFPSENGGRSAYTFKRDDVNDDLAK